MIVKNSFDRNNLNIFTKYVQKPKDIINNIIPLLDKNKTIIIYAREKADTEFIYSKIKHIIKCNYYHSDVDLNKRYIIQNDFSKGEIKCIVIYFIHLRIIKYMKVILIKLITIFIKK